MRHLLALFIIGLASWYSYEEGPITANGEKWDPEGLTCASYDYPFNTYLKVTNLDNSKSIVVRVNDRGGYKKLGRVIDLSQESFRRIAPLEEGLVRVKVEEAK